MVDGGIEIEARPVRAVERRADRMRGGLIGSSLLHLLAALLLILAVPWLTEAPPPVPRTIPINLVRLGERTAAPPSETQAPVTQDRAREVAKPDATQAVPVPETPPPPATERRAEAPSAQDPAPTPGRKPVAPKPMVAPRLAAARPPPAPAEDLSARLASLSRLRQPTPPLPPDPMQQEGSGPSNLSATSANAGRARNATYSVKDFIRAQVERRWYLDAQRPKGGDWTVAIHMEVTPDGTVNLAEVVETPRFRLDSAYRDFALSARNAVLLSSPLALPPGADTRSWDIVVDFSARQVMQ